MTTITLARNPAAKCWTATFKGGAMPQDMPLPLPWGLDASILDVAKDIRTRFIGATVFYICALGQKHHCA